MIGPFGRHEPDLLFVVEERVTFDIKREMGAGGCRPGFASRFERLLGSYFSDRASSGVAVLVVIITVVVVTHAGGAAEREQEQ
jgi:hypothetical protein